MQLDRTLLLVALAILAACSGEPTGSGVVASDITMELDTLDYGDAVRANIVVSDQSGAPITGSLSGPLTLQSSDTSIAKVGQDGLSLIGSGIGDATITARYGNVETSGVLPVRLGYAPAQKLTAGMDHNCILDRDGAAWCWGAGGYGALGQGEEKSSSLPVAVAGGHTFKTIVAGYGQTCAVDDHRRTWCWGDGITGGLGIDTTRSTVPREISGGIGDFIQLAAGDGHTCGLLYGGIVFCWGNNEDGELGRGDRDYFTSVPDLVKPTAMFARISASGRHSCGLTRLGKAYCWGDGVGGALGTGDDQDAMVPTAVLDSLTFVAITDGYYHTCAVDRTGQTFCWGYNEHGELGMGTASLTETSPVRVRSSVGFSFVSQGRAGSLCGIGISDRKLYCWGYNSNGQIGDGSTNDALTPERIGTFDARAVASGFSHTCAVDTQNRVFCWGMNAYGEVGNGTVGANVLTPTQVQGLEKISF